MIKKKTKTNVVAQKNKASGSAKAVAAPAPPSVNKTFLLETILQARRSDLDVLAEKRLVKKTPKLKSDYADAKANVINTMKGLSR